MWWNISIYGIHLRLLVSRPVSIVKVLYTDSESILKVSGGLCVPFRVGRGIRQGCAMSQMLYTLATELMFSCLSS